MTKVSVISASNLALMLIPLFTSQIIQARWGHGIKSNLVATARMIIQLLLVGFFLEELFSSEHDFLNIVILTIMLLSASLISVRKTKKKSTESVLKAILSLGVGGIPILVLVIKVVLQQNLLSSPVLLVPIAGMIFSSGMNALSIGAERFDSEIDKGESMDRAASKALEASMIPITNTFFAVGLVSLPGMMTGQILSGTPPLIAVRYQIVVMAMTYSSAALSTTIFLTLKKRDTQTS